MDRDTLIGILLLPVFFIMFCFSAPIVLIKRIFAKSVNLQGRVYDPHECVGCPYEDCVGCRNAGYK